MLTMGS
jgi:hypothetical protein